MGMPGEVMEIPNGKYVVHIASPDSPIMCGADQNCRPALRADLVLERAAGHMRDRAATYDKPEGERSMGRAVEAFNAIAGRDLSESEGWLLLQVLKDVCLFQRPGYHADSAEDCTAYSALKAEAKAREAHAQR